MKPVPVAEIPTDPVDVPTAVWAIAASTAVEAVWRNELGGLTFRIDGATESARYLKWVEQGTPELDLAAEAERLEWVRQWAAVPEVLSLGTNDEGTWLVTRALPGRSAVDPVWLGQPARAAAVLGQGLRKLHDAVPLDDCPYSWSIASRMGRVEERLVQCAGPRNWSPEHRDLTILEARARLADAPDIDCLVVCHGDAYAPNTLLSSEGTFLGHVDLGSLGAADRWADLAVAAWSTEWNYGPGYDHLVYEGYEIDPDPKRIEYYRLLWDLA